MNQVPPPVPRTNAAAVTNVRLPPHIANAILKARGKEGLKQYLVAQMQAKPTRPANTSNTQQTSTVFNHPQPQTVAKRPAPKTNEADKPHHKRPRIKQKVGTVCNDRDIIISELTKTPTFHIFMKMPYEVYLNSYILLTFDIDITNNLSLCDKAKSSCGDRQVYVPRSWQHEALAKQVFHFRLWRTCQGHQ